MEDEYKASEVGEFMNRLDESVFNLEETVWELIKRLRPILTEKDTVDYALKDFEPCSPLAKNIASATDRVIKLRCKVEDTLTNLAI